MLFLLSGREASSRLLPLSDIHTQSNMRTHPINSLPSPECCGRCAARLLPLRLLALDEGPLAVVAVGPPEEADGMRRIPSPPERDLSSSLVGNTKSSTFPLPNPLPPLPLPSLDEAMEAREASNRTPAEPAVVALAGPVEAIRLREDRTLEAEVPKELSKVWLAILDSGELRMDTSIRDRLAIPSAAAPVPDTPDSGGASADGEGEV